MYIEFLLPNNAVAAQHKRIMVYQALREWANRYSVPYKTKLVKLFERVTFDNDEYYMLFSLTWNPKKYPVLEGWRLVDNLNNKNKFDCVV